MKNLIAESLNLFREKFTQYYANDYILENDRIAILSNVEAFWKEKMEKMYQAGFEERGEIMQAKAAVYLDYCKIGNRCNEIKFLMEQAGDKAIAQRDKELLEELSRIVQDPTSFENPDGAIDFCNGYNECRLYLIAYLTKKS